MPNDAHLPSFETPPAGLPVPSRPGRALAATLLLIATLAVAWSIGGNDDGAAPAATAATATTPISRLRGCEQHPTRAARSACYTTELRTQLRSNAPRAVAVINWHAAESRWFARNCHMLLHPLGRAYTGGVDPASIRNQGKDCIAGFMHGYLEQRLGTAGRLSPALVSAACHAGTTSLQHADCEHGIGHVLMRNLDNDVPAAIARCARLGDAKFTRHCAGGVLMENRFAAAGRDAAAPTRFHDSARPLRTCAAVPVRLHATCVAWAVRDVPSSQRVAWCARRAEAMRSSCLHAVGAIADRPTRTCARSADCWWGAGYSLTAASARGTDEYSAACAGAPTRAARMTCATGAGVRIGATAPATTADEPGYLCRAFTTAALHDACVRGVGQRTLPIDFV